MHISLIAALTSSHVIGKNNGLPWRMPNDLAYFKKMTLHKIIIMGRKTFESMGRALPQRRNIIITRNPNFSAPNIEVFQSLEKALTYLQKEVHLKETEVFIIGGAEIYSASLPLADKMYLTLIDADIEGDAFFPRWPQNEWKEISREDHHKDENNDYNYSFVVFQRV